MATTMPFKAVLFDLDGTLINSLEAIGDAVNRTLAKEGFPVHELDAYRFFVGDGFRMLISRALPEGRRTPENITRCLEMFKVDYEKNWRRKSRLYPQIPQMLDALVDRGVKLAILSNKAHDFTKAHVRALLSSWPFHAVLGLREGMPPKPDPAGALEIARRLRVPPSQVLFLGDSAVDMKTAVAARMFPAGAGWGFRPAQELQEAGCRAWIQHPMALLELLG